MGRIESLREHVAAGQAAAEAQLTIQRGQLIDAAMEDAAEILGQGFIIGDASDTCVHHFGRMAFVGETATPYTELERQIAAADSQYVPVLVISHQDADPGAYAIGDSFALSIVDTSSPYFQSSRTREEDVKLSVLSSKTAGVETRSLELIGKTLIVDGDLNQLLVNGQAKISDSLELRKHVEADSGLGKGMPSDYTFRDYTEELILRSIDDHGVVRDPEVLVGTEAVEKALNAVLGHSVERLVRFAHMLGVYDEALELALPELAIQIAAANEFAEKVGLKQSSFSLR